MAPVKRSLAQHLGKGVLGVINVPWKLTKVVVLSLEKFGDGLEATSDYMLN